MLARGTSLKYYTPAGDQVSLKITGGGIIDDLLGGTGQGITLSVVGAIGSVFAFNAFAPDVLSPTAIRWLSLIVFGGAGIAAGVGLFLVLRAQRARAKSASTSSQSPSSSKADDPGS